MDPISTVKSFFNDFCDDQKRDEIINKVWDVAKTAFFCLAALAFYATAEIFFIPGLILGIAFSENFQLLIDRINLIWQTQPTSFLTVSGVIFGVGAFLALPFTLGISAGFCGAYLGSKLYQKAIEITNEEQAKLTAAVTV